MRRDVLDLIFKKYVSHVVDLGLEKPVPEPASEADLQRVQSDAKEKLGVQLDPGYLHLASLGDGIGASGAKIYSTRRRRIPVPGTEGIRYWEWEWIIQENLDWRKFGTGSPRAGCDPNDWIIYGIGELKYIIQDLPSGRFQLRPREAPDMRLRDFATFEELLWEVFLYSLELGDFPAAGPHS